MTVPTAVGSDLKAELIRDAHLARRAIADCLTVASKLHDKSADIRDLIGNVATSLRSLSDVAESKAMAKLGDGIQETVTYLEAVTNGGSDDTDGYATEFPDLAEYLRLRRGEMVVIAARPSVGKTALALQLALSLARRDPSPVPCGFFSLEMATELLRRRALLQLAKISLRTLREASISVAKWQDIMDASILIRGLPIWVDDGSRHTIQDITSRARRMVADHGCKCVFIDYLQLIRASRHAKSREVEVSEISAGCKSMAKELSIPVVVLAQLNRQAEDSPKVSHLRESGAIEQDADVIALLHTGQVDPDSGAIDVEVGVRKHRNGPTGVAHLLFFPQFTRFESVSRFSEDRF